MISRLLASAAVLFMLTAPALANQCPTLMKQIDQALAQNPKVSGEQMAEVKKLRAEGQMLHETGKHAEAIDTLNEAKAILGM